MWLVVGARPPAGRVPSPSSGRQKPHPTPTPGVRSGASPYRSPVTAPKPRRLRAVRGARPRPRLAHSVPARESYHLLLYDYVEDILERRAPYREEHLERIATEGEAGSVAMAGPLGDPPRGAAILFKGVDQNAVEEFAREDPHVRAGLVPTWRVERWLVL